MKFCVVLTFLLAAPLTAFCQPEAKERPADFSFEYQMYPAGMMPSIKSEIGLGKYYKHSLEGRIAYNRTRRRDWGEHEDERGGGWGGSLGYRYYVTKPFRYLYILARADVWQLGIDHHTGNDQGRTNVTVFQPTTGIGYKFILLDKKTRLFITPQLAFGREINVKTKGEEVGQGNIGLWGVDIGLGF